MLSMLENSSRRAFSIMQVEMLAVGLGVSLIVGEPRSSDG